MDEPLRVRLFGKFEAVRGDDPVPGLHRREGERLLAYLLVRTPGPVSTQELARWFWPAESPVGSGDGVGHFPSVRQALSTLRSTLGADAERLTRAQTGFVKLDTTGLSVDLLDFDRLSRVDVAQDGGLAAEQAARLYRGPLLADWRDAWVIEARRLRRLRYLLLLRQLALRAREAGLVADEERWTRTLLDTEPGDEEMGRGLLRLLSATGRQVEALAALTALQETLATQKRSPAPETFELAELLRRQREAGSIGSGSRGSSSAPLGEEAGRKVVQSPPAPLPDAGTGMLDIEPAGGAVAVDSRFYVERAQDAQFHAALRRGDSIVLVKGARQVGKTSLLARGLQRARESGAKVVLTDFQQLGAAQLASADAFYSALASLIARQLDLPFSRSEWADDDAGPNMRMEEFLRFTVLAPLSQPLIWAVDEADRLFSCAFGSEVFGLFRSWHNARALNPATEFRRLTLAISYATEAQLFITDLNQSPFNVGTRLNLSDFTLAEAATLNERYGKAALPPSALHELTALVGGQPYLLRCALNEAAQGTPITALLASADRDEGLFGDHLRRLWASLERSPDLLPVLRAFVEGAEPALTTGAFYRLRAAGILAGHAPGEATFRCRLYKNFFAYQFAVSLP